MCGLAGAIEPEVKLHFNQCPVVGASYEPLEWFGDRA
jgi:hypothetical protein